MKGQMRKDALKFRKPLLEGTTLSIDPSSNSMGYAIFVKGEKTHTGCKIFDKTAIFNKLPSIYAFVAELQEKYEFDIMVIEQIRTTTRKGQDTTGAQMYRFFAPYQLMLAVGAIGAAVKKPVMEMPPSAWKATATRLGLPKTDENDAMCIGIRAIELAREEWEIWNARRLLNKKKRQ